MNQKTCSSPLTTSPYTKPFNPDSLEHDSEQNILCLQHSLDLSYICFSCNNKILCSKCLMESNHKGHDIKSGEKSKMYIKNYLSEFLIRLQSKSQILQILHDQLTKNIAIVFNQTFKYQQNIQQQFNGLIELIRERKQEIFQTIKKQYNNYSNEINNNIIQIRQFRQQYQKTTQLISDKLESYNLYDLTHYFCVNKIQIDDMVQEHQIHRFKQKLYDIKWNVDHDLIYQLQQKVNLLKVGVELNYPGFDKEKKKNTKKVLKIETSTKKRQIKEKNSSRNRHSHAHLLSYLTYTPKNLSKEKYKKSSQVSNILKKRKKSSGKMVSVPASPGKDSSDYFSMQDTRKKIFKKPKN